MTQKEKLEYYAVITFIREYNRTHKRKFVFGTLHKPPMPDALCKLNKLKTAQKRAARSNKAITFVYANKNTDCSLGTSASIDLFKGFKKYSIVVYAERNDWNKLPDIVKNGINSPKAGKYIPKTVIVNSKLDKIICIVPYAKTKERKKLIKRAQAPISNYKAFTK